MKKHPDGGTSFLALLESRACHFREFGKLKTADNYSCARKHLSRFLCGKDLTVAQLSVALMRDFQLYLSGRGLKQNTVSLYNRVLKAAYRYALDEDLVATDRRPFRKCFTGQERTCKRAADEATVRRMMRLDLSGQADLDLARDLFLFSLCMQGMPFVDIAHLTKAQLRNGQITYLRHKTGAQLTVVLHPRARAVIDKWQTDDPDCPYVFPILYSVRRRTPLKYASALRLYNKRLHRLSALMGMERPLSSYVARHTWASLARKFGIKDYVISEAMGHRRLTTTLIYLASPDARLIGAANRKVIDTLFSPKLRRTGAS